MTHGPCRSGAPYSTTAKVYDLLYRIIPKDYAAEADELHRLVQERAPGAASLLDVACGTGAHLAHLRRWYDVVGVDLQRSMLAEARRRLPGVPLAVGDMRTLALRRRFDAVVCLFSSSGYMRSPAELDAAVAALARHLAPRGVLVVDGWVRPEAWADHRPPDAVAGRAGDLALARVTITRRDGRRSRMEMHHLVGTPDGVEHLVETHELTLFTDDEYRGAFARAGLDADVLPSPMRDRDRYVGVRR
ncbi:MAG TPA: class I SAM-dependent methyltransferase [Acidimicrobiales bacterium]